MTREKTANNDMRIFLRLFIVILFGASLFMVAKSGSEQWQRYQTAPPFDPQWVRLSPLELATLPLATYWTMPMGSEHGALTYNAQPFRVTRHLGDDLNGIGGNNSDLGDTVYAAATGVVVYNGVPGPGWGKVIIMAHQITDQTSGKPEMVQSMYAHLQTSEVTMGAVIKRGTRIGTVGTAEGKYLAHLHFEIRKGPYVNPSMGYADAPLNRISPEKFIAERNDLQPAPGQRTE